MIRLISAGGAAAICSSTWSKPPGQPPIAPHSPLLSIGIAATAPLTAASPRPPSSSSVARRTCARPAHREDAAHHEEMHVAMGMHSAGCCGMIICGLRGQL